MHVYVNELVTSTAIECHYRFIGNSTDTSPSGAAKQPSLSTCSPAGMITTGTCDVALF